MFFFFSSRRRHTRCSRDWSSDVCSSDLGTPALAVAFSALWSMVLAVSGTFEQLFTYVVFASWIFAALAAASVFVLRRRRPDAPRPFRVPGYPVTPALFIAAAAAIVGNTIVARPVQAL